MASTWYYSEQVVTTGAGVTASSPKTTNLVLPDAYVNRIKIRWPEGHNGQTGIYLAKSGDALIPLVSPPTFIVATGDEEWFEVGDEIQGGLQAITYNTGRFLHSHYLRIEYVQMAQWTGSGVQAPTIVPITSG